MKCFRDFYLGRSREWYIELFVLFYMSIYGAGIRIRNWSDISRSEDVNLRVVVLSQWTKYLFAISSEAFQEIPAILFFINLFVDDFDELIDKLAALIWAHHRRLVSFRAIQHDGDTPLSQRFRGPGLRRLDDLIKVVEIRICILLFLLFYLLLLLLLTLRLIFYLMINISLINLLF